MAFNAAPGERLSRFLTDRDHYSIAKGIVRHTAFSPPKNQRLSVYHTTGVSDAEIWNIGDRYVAPARGPILARADVNSQVIYENGLEVVVTGDPHPLHADVINWDPDRRKARLQATKLADKSILIFKT